MPGRIRDYVSKRAHYLLPFVFFFACSAAPLYAQQPTKSCGDEVCTWTKKVLASAASGFSHLPVRLKDAKDKWTLQTALPGDSFSEPCAVEMYGPDYIRGKVGCFSSELTEEKRRALFERFIAVLSPLMLDAKPVAYPDTLYGHLDCGLSEPCAAWLSIFYKRSGKTLGQVSFTVETEAAAGATGAVKPALNAPPVYSSAAAAKQWLALVVAMPHSFSDLPRRIECQGCGVEFALTFPGLTFGAPCSLRDSSVACGTGDVPAEDARAAYDDAKRTIRQLLPNWYFRELTPENIAADRKNDWWKSHSTFDADVKPLDEFRSGKIRIGYVHEPNAARGSTWVGLDAVPPDTAMGAQGSGYEQLKGYVADLQKNPREDAVRERAIKTALTLDPKPALPDAALEAEGRAEYRIKHANSTSDFRTAAEEYEKALLVAPWVAADYFNEGVAYEKAEYPDKAIAAFRWYLMAAPNAEDANDVRKRIAGLQVADQEKRAAANAYVQERYQHGGLDDFLKMTRGKLYSANWCAPGNRQENIPGAKGGRQPMGCTWDEYRANTNWYHFNQYSFRFEWRYRDGYAYFVTAGAQDPFATAMIRVGGPGMSVSNLKWEWRRFAGLNNFTWEPMFAEFQRDLSGFFYTTETTDPKTAPSRRFHYQWYAAQ